MQVRTFSPLRFERVPISQQVVASHRALTRLPPGYPLQFRTAKLPFSFIQCAEASTVSIQVLSRGVPRTLSELAVQDSGCENPWSNRVRARPAQQEVRFGFVRGHLFYRTTRDDPP